MRLPVTCYQKGGINHVYLQSYKEWLDKQALAPNTARAYHSHIKQFLQFIEYSPLSDTALNDCDSMRAAIDLYLEFLRQAKRERVTINSHIDAFNNFCRFLNLESPGVKRERRYHKTPKVLTYAEQERFLNSVEKQELVRDRAMALILFYSALRIGDCASLRIDQVGAGATCICFEEGMTMQLNELTATTLYKWLEQRHQLPGAKESAALWLTNQGQPLSVSGIAFVIKRIGWQAKLALSVETLKRTCLARASNRMGAHELATVFGGFVSPAAISRCSASD